MLNPVTSYDLKRLEVGILRIRQKNENRKGWCVTDSKLWAHSFTLGDIPQLPQHLCSKMKS